MTLNELIDRGLDDLEVTAVYFHSPCSDSGDVQFFKQSYSGFYPEGTAYQFAQCFRALSYKVEMLSGRVHAATGIFTETRTGERHIDGWNLLNRCPPRLHDRITHVHTGYWNKRGEIYAKHGCIWTAAAVKEWNEHEQKTVQGINQKAGGGSQGVC